MVSVLVACLSLRGSVLTALVGMQVNSHTYLSWANPSQFWEVLEYCTSFSTNALQSHLIIRNPF